MDSELSSLLSAPFLGAIQKVSVTDLFGTMSSHTEAGPHCGQPEHSVLPEETRLFLLQMGHPPHLDKRIPI